MKCIFCVSLKLYVLSPTHTVHGKLHAKHLFDIDAKIWELQIQIGEKRHLRSKYAF